MMKRFICIDPGKGGAIAVRDGLTIAEVAKMPDSCADLRDFIERVCECRKTSDTDIVAYLEQVSAMPGQGVTSMFTFGNGFGHLEQVLADFRIRTVRVRPNLWEKTLGLTDKKGTPKIQHKNKLKARAQELFPDIKVTAYNQDALLISEYAIKVEGISTREEN